MALGWGADRACEVAPPWRDQSRGYASVEICQEESILASTSCRIMITLSWLSCKRYRPPPALHFCLFLFGNRQGHVLTPKKGLS
jgi:hypothetical protein